MGILARLRNAFGRSRKAREAPVEETTQATAATGESCEERPRRTAEPARPDSTSGTAGEATTPAARERETAGAPHGAEAPEPREHDLVSAAFGGHTSPRPPVGPAAPEPDTADRHAAPGAERGSEAGGRGETDREDTPARQDDDPPSTPAPGPEPTRKRTGAGDAATGTRSRARTAPPTAEETETAGGTDSGTGTETGTDTRTNTATEAGEPVGADPSPAGRPDGRITEPEASPVPRSDSAPMPVGDRGSTPTPDQAPPPSQAPAIPHSRPTAPEADGTRPSATGDPAPGDGGETRVAERVTGVPAPTSPTDGREATDGPVTVAAARATVPASDPHPAPARVAAAASAGAATCDVADPAQATPTAVSPATTPRQPTCPEPLPVPAVAPAPQAAEPTRTDGTPGPAEEASAAHGETTPRGPAISSARLRSRAPGLADSYRAAGAALRKHGLAGTRAKVYLVLDRSASMRPYYKDGSTQALAERTLALAAQVDPGATVRVVFFSTEVDGVGELTLRDHEGVIERLHTGLGRMGRTNYHAAVTEVIALHGKSDDPAAPALVVFQTDGAPDARTPATKALAQAAADHPKVFFSFVAFGDPRGKASDYLRRLGTGNTGYFLAGESPREVPDKDLYTAVLAAWRP